MSRIPPQSGLATDSGGESRCALVLYGSETGNAQAAAEDLGQLVRRIHFASTILEMDAVEPSELIAYNLVVFAVSTTGQGDLPRNAQIFWRRLLRKKLPATYLSNVRFAILGLGDSSYPKFNFAALKLHKRLLQLGAQEIAQKAEADEQHEEGSDTIFLPWKDRLREQLLTLYPLKEGVEPIPHDALLQPPWLLASQPDDGLASSASERNAAPRPSGNSAVTPLRVKFQANDRVTPVEHWQDVRHLVFEADAAYPYAPGDILAIHPHNPDEDVQQLVDMMHWHNIADTSVRVVANKDCTPAPSGPAPAIHPHIPNAQLPIRRILTECVDLNAIPKRSFFSLLAHFTNDEYQKTRLVEFADPQYTDELFDYTTRPRRSILEVLQEFDSVKIPWQWVLEVFPLMRERQFSIASGGPLKITSQGKARFELLVAIVKYKTVIRKIRRGVCTRYLEGLKLGSSLDVELIKGSLDITKAQAGVPLLMIGPGTGVAPMRSLIWERAQWNDSRNSQASSEVAMANGHVIGPSILLFGCRNETADYFFHDEWPRLKESAALEVRAAFSRDQSAKVYVQDLVGEMADRIYHLLHDAKGTVCICGSSGKMPQAVREALVDVFQEGMGSERSAAEAYLRTMEKESRYKQETW